MTEMDLIDGIGALLYIASCPHGHKAEDADRWGTRKLGVRPGNGAPLRARVVSFFLPCERGLNSHTDGNGTIWG